MNYSALMLRFFCLTVCIKIIYGYVLFAANIEDFKSIARKVVSETFIEKLMKIATDSNYELDTKEENKNNPRLKANVDNRQRAVLKKPQKQRKRRPLNIGKKIDFEELVERVRERLESEYKNKHRNRSIYSKQKQKNMQKNVKRDSDVRNNNNFKRVTVGSSIVNDEISEGFEIVKKKIEDIQNVQPNKNNYEEAVTYADPMVYTIDEVDVTERIGINLSDISNNKNKNEKVSIYINQDIGENEGELPFKKIKIDKDDSYEDYVIPVKESNIFASEERLVSNDDPKNIRIINKPRGYNVKNVVRETAEYTTTKILKRIAKIEDINKQRFQIASTYDERDNFVKPITPKQTTNKKISIRYQSFVQIKDIKKNEFGVSASNNDKSYSESYRSPQYKTTKRMHDVQREITESDRFEIAYDDGGRYRKDPTTKRRPNFVQKHRLKIANNKDTTEYRPYDAPDFVPVKDRQKNRLKITYKNFEKRPVDYSTETPEYNKIVTVGSNEIKAKTQSLWFDDEPIKDTAILSSEHRRPGTGIPTRLTYKMVSPNYYISLPTVAQKYDFNEPIPERDRDREVLKYISNPPAKINKKVNI